MIKSKTPTTQSNNQRSNALNSNKGTTGSNVTNAKSHGNRGAQLNQNKITTKK
ncbi:hypothetical protein [Paludibacterium denitrificans]|uniref:hypothetical protein n=1 Tax=Paludibacterium denitrificans TaxID=2675226 RepID=UPI001E361858|nr:hypothetical protein [Paludibacterium denitrificans]